MLVRAKRPTREPPKLILRVGEPQPQITNPTNPYTTRLHGTFEKIKKPLVYQKCTNLQAKTHEKIQLKTRPQDLKILWFFLCMPNSTPNAIQGLHEARVQHLFSKRQSKQANSQRTCA